MNNKGIAVILVTLLIVLGIYAITRVQNQPLTENTTTSESQLPAKAPQELNTAITANNGEFTPNIINFQSHDNVVLQVTAQDRDYTFNLEEIGLTQTIARGSTTEVSLVGLGVGSHTFTCGTGCSGTITVAVEAD